MDFEVSGQVFEWRGPAPFYFLAMSLEQSEEIETYKRELSYGWGVIPAEVTLGEVTSTTALIPKDGVFLVPLKDLFRKPAGVRAGSEVSLTVRLRG